LHSGRGKVAFFIQTAALANGFFQVFGTDEFAMLDAADFQTKAVGSQIHGGEAISDRHVVWVLRLDGTPTSIAFGRVVAVF
jgi:hypothetical protein